MVAARERRRTEAARAAARARARSSWSSLEPSGNAGGGDCRSTRERAAVPRAGVGVGGGAGAGASSAGGIVVRSTAAAERSEESGGEIFWASLGLPPLPVVISNFGDWIGVVTDGFLRRPWAYAKFGPSIGMEWNGMAQSKMENKKYSE